MSTLVFSHPAMLWGLVASGLPLVIHLINRHRARRRPFAAMDFLLRVKRRSARRILLRHILLLVVRTLLIASLVIAAAGPVLRARESLARRGPTSSALVIDQSLSMRASYSGHDVFDAALERARAFVRGMLPGDRICLLGAGRSCEVLVNPCSDSSAALLDAIDRLQPQWGSSDLPGALQKAAGLLYSAGAAAGRQARILVLTDAARHAFDGAGSIQPAARTGDATGNWPPLTIENVAPDADRDNLAVAGVRLRDQSHYLELSSELVSFANRAFEGVPLEVRAGERVLSRGFADLVAGSRTTKTFNIRAPEKAALMKVVAKAGDALAADNQRLVHVSGRRQIHALLINGDMRPVLRQDELFYLENALSPAGENVSGIHFLSVTPDRFNRKALEGVEVVFLANVSGLSPKAVSSLRSFVRAGGGLFISLGNRVEVERTDRILGDLLPWPLRDIVALGPPDPDGVYRRGLGFKDARLDHPVLEIFSADSLSALLAVRSWRAAVLDPGRAEPGSSVLLKYENGAPALVQGRLGNGRIMLFTSTLDRDWNSWPARASYLPFIQQTCAYLAGRLEKRPPLQVVVGATVRLPLVAGSDGYRLTAPDGKRFDLAPVAPAGGAEGPGAPAAQAIFTKTDLPGWYEIVPTKKGHPLRTGTLPGMIVHLPPGESDLRPISPAELKAFLGEGASLVRSSGAASLASSRTELFLLMALLLLLLEALLSRK